MWADLQPLLDQELSRLGDKYRVPIVLCDLEGKTRKEAAKLLGVPEGTINSRLARGRAMLAKRLTRQGITYSAGALTAVLAQQTASASVPAALIAATLKAGGMFAVGGSASNNAAILAKGVLKAMFITKLTKVAAVLSILGMMVLFTVTLAGGERRIIQRGLAAKTREKNQDAAPKPKTDKEQLQGQWKVVSGERYGEEISPDDLKSIVTEINFDGDKMSFKAGDAKLRPFKLDPSKKPKEIDFYMGEGFVPAAYDLVGNTLRICIPQADPSTPPGVFLVIGRPTQVSGTGPIRYLIQFERVSEATKAVERDASSLKEPGTSSRSKSAASIRKKRLARTKLSPFPGTRS